MKKKLKINWAEPSLDQEEVEAVKRAVESGWIGGNGPETQKYAREFAFYVNSRYALPVCNGTCGLMLGLLAFREKEDLRCAVPTWTFIATANSAQVLVRKYKIKLIDCQKTTFNINWKNIPSNCNILMPVDVGGLPVDYDEIMSLPFPHYTFADSAESLGSQYRGKMVGSIADVHLFSTHAAKIKTTGEGGILTMNDKELYETMYSICNQGYSKNRKPWEYHHDRIGLNFRMTEMQSAIGRVQLRKLPKFLKNREEFADIYKDRLGDRVLYQAIPKDRKMSWFLFTIIVDPKKRDTIVKKLIKTGIQVKTWKPVHLQPPYLIENLSLPNSEWLYNRVINLPIHNALTEEDVKCISEEVKRLI